MAMDRREFLRTASLVGGAALVPGLAGCAWLPPPDLPAGFNGLLGGPAAQAPVSHIVVVMMENRSFDHWLGWMAQDEAFLAAGRSRYGSRFRVDGAQQQSYDGPLGTLQTEPLVGDPDQTNPYRGCGFGDPSHSWTKGRAQRDQGFIGADAGNDPFALGYYLGGDLPFTSNLAKRFTTLDHSHASVLGPTYPNREYLHSAQSGGNKTNALPSGGGFAWATIWDKLAAANVPAKYYYSDLPVLGLWGSRMAPFLNPISRFYEDCAAGTLPNVSFVDPTFLGGGQEDDHPLADVHAGQAFQRRVFKAFSESPNWASGLFVLTYDEWGGFFDHIRPPVLTDDRSSTVDADNFGQAGFRIPTVIASPFAQPGFVDHRTYDHTSVLRFLEWRFLGAPAEGPGNASGSWFLTSRDRFAPNLGASLSRTVSDPDLHFDIDGLPIRPPTPQCGTATATTTARSGEVVTSSTTLTRDDFLPTIFETSYESGWFERAGVPVLGQ